MNLFRRDLFHFDPDGAPAGEAAVADPPEEAVEAPEAIAEPAAPSWSGVSREEWEQTQQFIQAAGPFLQNLALEYQQREVQQQQPPPEQLPEWDPFDEAVVQAHVEARIRSGIEQALGPYQGILGQVAQETSMRQATSALDQLGTQVGPFDRDAALLIAAPMIDAGQSPDQSLRAAAQYMHELETRIREDERKKLQGEFEQLRTAGATGGPGRAPGVAATEFDKVPTGPRRYEEAIERAMARRTGGFPVG